MSDVSETANKLGWLGRNSGRRYPIDESASAVGSNGGVLPDDFLTDLRLSWPGPRHSRAFISFAEVSDHIVSLGLSSDTNGTVLPLAFITLAVSDAEAKVHKLVPLVKGAAGFVTFGDVEERFYARFDNSAGSLLVPAAAAPYSTSGVQSLGVAGLMGLSGHIKIQAGSDIRVRQTYATDRSGNYYPAIAIGLYSANEQSETHAKYIGNCNTRPENNNCQQDGLPPAIRTVNGLGFGGKTNLQLVFAAGGITPGDTGVFPVNSLVLSYDTTVQAICAGVNRPAVIAEVLDPCVVPDDVVAAVCEMAGLPVSMVGDISNWDTANWIQSNTELLPAGEGIRLANSCGGFAVYGTCAYAESTDMTINLQTKLDLPEGQVAKNCEQAGIVVNYLQNFNLYKSFENPIVVSKQSDIRIGFEVVSVPTSSSPGTSRNYLQLLASKDGVVRFRKLLPRPLGFVSSDGQKDEPIVDLSLTIHVVTPDEATAKHPVGTVVGRAKLTLALTTVNLDLALADYGPPYGKHGLYSTLGTKASFTKFEITR